MRIGIAVFLSALVMSGAFAQQPTQDQIISQYYAETGACRMEVAQWMKRALEAEKRLEEAKKEIKK